MNEENKRLCEEIPYLALHNAWTGKALKDYDYEVTEADRLPRGWRKLFIQMCRDIRQPLIDAGLFDKFYFTEVKEKYNTLRAYNSGGTKEVSRIIGKYEHISRYVCQICGKPADVETDGWIESYCYKCFGASNAPAYPIKFEPIMTIHTYSHGEETTEHIDCSEEWNRLMNEVNE